MIRYISSADAPPPAGHYSQATCFGGQLFISGQLPVRPDAADHSASAEPFHIQAERALSNMLSVLKASGGSEKQLVKVGAYIVGIENWNTFNRVYTRMLGCFRPARVIVPVPELHFGYLVEVDAIAVGVNTEDADRAAS